MKIAAYLSPDEIPIEILNVGAPEIEHGDLKKRLEMPLGATQIVELLVKFSLFKRKSNDSLSIHRLVQETLRDRCNSEGETNQVLASAIRMMHQTFLNCVGGTDFLRDFYNRLASQPRSVTKPHLIPLGKILCGRGIAHLKMGKFQAAVDDFDASTYLDTQYFRGYYWKAYTLCKLVESGRTEFTSRAQATFAMLHFKFKHSKLNDIKKLQSQFAELLLRIEYNFVSRVSELKELERRFGVRNDFSNVSHTII
ncbi:hypothetical protein OS493_004556 [Desmophyllum pertusum]|uniref:DUF7779 domain-containing protein n=1 Tax=Desmophyllum pertusum TaxID=174260 RepID=A0A9W9ZJ90_9CNID|nr:hypothetical protein OS493_004556 [Desmophyllum pertusum]